MEEAIERAAREMLGKGSFSARFKASFGCSIAVVAQLYALINNETTFQIKHLLWGLLFLKQYSIETTHARFVRVDEKTFRKWAWKAIEHLSDLDIVGFV